jgi:hypothetical protein
MFLNSGLYRISRLSNIDLSTLTGHTVNSTCFESKVVFNWWWVVKNLLGWIPVLLMLYFDSILLRCPKIVWMYGKQAVRRGFSLLSLGVLDVGLRAH